MVGITGFEPATSSSRTKRATKLRHIPVAGGSCPLHSGYITYALRSDQNASSAGRRRPTRIGRAERVCYPWRSRTRSNDADGGQNTRTGAYLEVPSPLETSIHMFP